MYAAAVAMALLLAACSAPQPPAAAPVVAVPLPLPPPPWRDDAPLSVTSGQWRWTDASRDRVIGAQWHAPSASAAQALLLVLPGLAQGSSAPPALIEALVGSGFAVVTIGHAGNDAAVWRSPEARRADFTEAARRMYGASDVTERGADVRFVLDALEKQPPPWLAAGALRRVGVVGIGLGAQTAQWLLGEPMARTQVATSEPRLVAAALLGPYVGFEGPAMHQRYEAIVTPLLVAYGLTETDPYGLGMTSQQRRAMVLELRNARVTELRLPTSSLAGALTPGAVPGVGGRRSCGARRSRTDVTLRAADARAGPGGPGGGTPAGKGSPQGGAMTPPGGGTDVTTGTERRADGRGVRHRRARGADRASAVGTGVFRSRTARQPRRARVAGRPPSGTGAMDDVCGRPPVTRAPRGRSAP